MDGISANCAIMMIWRGTFLADTRNVAVVGSVGIGTAFKD